MCVKKAVPRYLKKKKSEDSSLVQTLMSSYPSQIVYVSEAGLYVYEYAGSNTWDKKHFCSLRDEYELASYTERKLKDTIGYISISEEGHN
jgi:hypothetical protein